jgi:mono/diheme cytochrome c family protein
MRIMRPSNCAVVCILTLSLWGSSRAEELTLPNELASRVRSIFLAKCSECHGRGLARPRAALYLPELGTLAANREWVVPYEPDKSYLWTLVRNEDMPAKGAKAGPLNAHEKEIVRAWIAAGAPAPPSPAAPSKAPGPPAPSQRPGIRTPR